MGPDENYWIGAKGGLLKEKHRRCMGDAVWLFLWFLLKQTGVNEEGEGVVEYGKAQTRADIADRTGYPEWQVKRWMDRLRRTEYIRTVLIRSEGVQIFVQKAKDKTRKPRRVGANQHRLEAEVGANQHRGCQPAPTQTNENITTKQELGAPISKDLSYYNNTAAAKSAAVSISFSEVLKQKQIPPLLTAAQLDERRRFLLDQADEIRRRPV